MVWNCHRILTCLKCLEKLDIKVKFKIYTTRERLLSSSSESDFENIEELPDIDPRQFLWSAQNLAPKVFDKNLPGIKANINDKSSILEIFQLFFPENMVEHIVREINTYYTTKTVRSRQ